MRLIDADAMKTHIMEFACDPCKKYGADRDGIRCPFCNTGNLLGEIDDAPTVDAVEVVRCKDCKYGIDWDGRLGCEWHGFYQTEPDWFCADGERREDDND